MLGVYIGVCVYIYMYNGVHRCMYAMKVPKECIKGVYNMSSYVPQPSSTLQPEQIVVDEETIHTL